MQSASSNFVRAATGAGGTWAEPNLRVDWSQTGYSGDDSIDNLTRQLGDWTVTHHLDDGYPNAATFISGIGVGQLEAGLGAPPMYLTANTPMTAAEYFSPFNTDSAVQAFERDVAPTTLDVGVIGDDGAERIRIFTGQMTDLPVRRGEAQITGVSATRMAMKRLVQPPAVYGFYQSAMATWPITYALHKCGLYASPPPQDGCRLWIPFHGSIRPVIPERNFPSLDNLMSVRIDTIHVRVAENSKWLDGPFVQSAGFQYVDGFQQVLGPNVTSTDGTYLEDGTDYMSQAGGAGKLECWVKGIAQNINAVPGASGGLLTWWRFLDEGTSTQYIDAHIYVDGGSTSRQLHLLVKDGVGSPLYGVTHSTPLPIDDQWHFIGFAWDYVAEKIWVNLDGVVESTACPSFTFANMPAEDVHVESRPYTNIRIPTAEFQFTTGSQVNPDTNPWLNEIPFTPTAVVTPSSTRLASVAERTPREAWELVGSFAQAELASMRTDENDMFEYLGLGHWAEDEQQVIVDRLSTDENAAPLDVNIDATKIYNSVQVTYGESYNQDAYRLVFSTQDVVTLPPGVTTLVLPFDPAATEVRRFAFTNIAAADTSEPTQINTLSANSASNGSGTYATTDQVSATIQSWNPGSAIVDITNVTSSTYYMANDKTWPTLTVAAKSLQTVSASVAESNASSIAIRGERALSVPAQALQTRYDARRLAQRVRSALRLPVPVVDEFEVFGDPRRQPGDLVTVADPTVTKASGQWRIQSITHESRHGAYTQTVRVRPAFTVGIVGTSLVGHCIVGPPEE
jgi:hypothetical protein